MSNEFISEKTLTAEQISEAAATGLVQLSDGGVFGFWRPAGTVTWFRRLDGTDREQNQYQLEFSKKLAASKDAAARTCAT